LYTQVSTFLESGRRVACLGWQACGTLVFLMPANRSPVTLLVTLPIAQ